MLHYVMLRYTKVIPHVTLRSATLHRYVKIRYTLHYTCYTKLGYRHVALCYVMVRYGPLRYIALTTLHYCALRYTTVRNPTVREDILPHVILPLYVTINTLT